MVVDRPGQFFTWGELDAVDAPEPARARLRRLVWLLDFLRFLTGQRITPTSGYRNPTQNAATPGSAPMSKHMTGEAVDFLVEGWSSEQTAALVVVLGELFPQAVQFDQVIAYEGPSRAQGGRGGHVHIGQWAGRKGGERREHRWAPKGTDEERLQPPRPEVKVWVRQWLASRVAGLQAAAAPRNA